MSVAAAAATSSNHEATVGKDDGETLSEVRRERDELLRENARLRNQVLVLTRGMRTLSKQFNARRPWGDAHPQEEQQPENVIDKTVMIDATASDPIIILTTAAEAHAPPPEADSSAASAALRPQAKRRRGQPQQRWVQRRG